MTNQNMTRFAAEILISVLTLIAPLAGRQPSVVHHHYKLIDLGTFGGPTSALFGFSRPLNDGGMVTGCADTAVLDPNLSSQNPYFVGNPYIAHSYLWLNGHRTSLRPLPGGNNTCTQWINNWGLVVGASDLNLIDPLTGFQEIRAVVWDRNGKAHDLGTLGGNGSVAWAINDYGQVTGNALNDILDDFSISGAFGMVGATQTHAFLWQSGVMRDLGTLPGGTNSGPYAINQHGEVAGLSATDAIVNPTTGLPTIHPFLWDGNKMIDLGSFGGTYGVAFDLNNSGQVTGISDRPGDDPNEFHAFLWPGKNGMMIDLPSLGGAGTESKAINDAGDVAGASSLAGTTDFHAVLWTNGKVVDLGVVPGDLCAEAMHINSKQQVVGYSNRDVCHTEDHTHGFLWESGVLFDLNQLISNDTS